MKRLTPGLVGPFVLSSDASSRAYLMFDLEKMTYSLSLYFPLCVTHVVGK